MKKFSLLLTLTAVLCQFSAFAGPKDHSKTLDAICEISLATVGQVVQFRTKRDLRHDLILGIISDLGTAGDAKRRVLTLDLSVYGTQELGCAFRDFDIDDIEIGSLLLAPHPHDDSVLRVLPSERANPIFQRLVKLKYGQPLDLTYSWNWFGGERHNVNGVVRFRRLFRAYVNGPLNVEFMRSWEKNFDSDILKVPLAQVVSIDKGPAQLIPLGFRFQAKTLGGVNLAGVYRGEESFGVPLAQIDESSVLVLPPEEILPEQRRVFDRFREYAANGYVRNIGLRVLELRGPYYIAHTGEFLGIEEVAGSGPAVKLLIEDARHGSYQRTILVPIRVIDPLRIEVPWHSGSLSRGGD